MKKLLLLPILLTILNTYAQKGFDIGLSGTANSTWILNQNNYGTLAPFSLAVVRVSEMNYKTTWGGNAGVTVGYNFTDNWGLKAEVQYNVTGQKYEDNFVGPASIPGYTFGAGGDRVNVKRDVKLQYLQIPILVRYMTTPGRVAKFFISLGPQIGFRTYASEVDKMVDHVYVPDSLNTNPKEKFQTVDVGFALQFGADVFATNNLYFELGLFNYVGITDINGAALRSYYSKNDVKYQRSINFRTGLMVGIHYIIGKGNKFRTNKM